MLSLLSCCKKFHWGWCIAWMSWLLWTWPSSWVWASEVICLPTKDLLKERSNCLLTEILKWFKKLTRKRIWKEIQDEFRCCFYHVEDHRYSSDEACYMKLFGTFQILLIQQINLCGVILHFFCYFLCTSVCDSMYPIKNPIKSLGWRKRNMF